ncbi:hypothetical protein [Aneurinibacillus terranovensis]|uniref:hypothetical protein n=1 Tax=Aneurinibacillus terranovensis TaxID=278991 RepID=UPI00041F9B91|nr:hypothetical protein [Aneurinibacillus terranovensis]
MNKKSIAVKVSKTLICCTVLSGIAVGGAVLPTHSAAAKPAARQGQTVKTGLYKLELPGEIIVVKGSGNMLVFKKSGKTVGGVEVLGYYDNQTMQNLLPNHSQVIQKRKVTRLILPASRYTLRSDAISGKKQGDEFHTFLLKKPRAYDVWIKKGALSEAEYGKLLKSFALLR